MTIQNLILLLSLLTAFNTFALFRLGYISNQVVNRLVEIDSELIDAKATGRL